jgi:ATP-binding cassette subfamily C protein
VRQRGGVVVIITHRPSALANVDLVGVMEQGRMKLMGPRDEVLKAVIKRPVEAAPVKQAPHLREVGA